jgi:hypothetical protein
MKPHGNAVFIDCDGVLVIGTTINATVRDWIKSQHSRGRTLILWSAQGELHARNTAHKAGITQCLHAIIPKPSLIIDDHPSQWLQWTQTIHPSGLRKTPLSKTVGSSQK